MTRWVLGTVLIGLWLASVSACGGQALEDDNGNSAAGSGSKPVTAPCQICAATALTCHGGPLPESIDVPRSTVSSTGCVFEAGVAVTVTCASNSATCPPGFGCPKGVVSGKNITFSGTSFACAAHN